jgi:hypothetical protein
MSTVELLRANLLSPLVLAFVLAKTAGSTVTLPKELYASLSIYLLFAIGLKGGVELSHAPLSVIALPAAVTVLLGVVTPLFAFFVLRKLGRFGRSDAAGIAAHYGSVSAVTFVAAQQLTAAAGTPSEGYMATLLTLLESPGIHVAIALGVLRPATRVAMVTGGGALVAGGPDVEPAHGEGGKSLKEILTSPTMVLLVGGLIVGALVGGRGYEPVKPFFEGGFKGALTLFLLEMGLVAGARMKDVRSAGPFLVAFAVIVPCVHGVLGVLLGRAAGLSIGGQTVLAAMAASASYIAAPAAVRANLPDANPALSLTAALAITFPFNLAVGIPLYHALATALG